MAIVVVAMLAGSALASSRDCLAAAHHERNVRGETMKGHLRRFGRGTTLVAMVAAYTAPIAALRTAAGATSGKNGFADVSRFLDNLASYVVYLAIIKEPA